MAQLPDYWVVRELTERDYGIDLMVEVFTPGLKDRKGKDAFAKTGAIFHVQIKGVDEPVTRNSFDIYGVLLSRKRPTFQICCALVFFGWFQDAQLSTQSCSGRLLFFYGQFVRTTANVVDG